MLIWCAWCITPSVDGRLAIINRSSFSDLRLACIRPTWCDDMLVRIKWQRWIVLSLTLVITAFLSGFSMPASRTPVRSNGMTNSLHQAVFRFDTRIVFSCEEFAREMVRRPLVNMTAPIEDRWARIKADSHVLRSSVYAPPECLVQAGLMVL